MMTYCISRNFLINILFLNINKLRYIILIICNYFENPIEVISDAFKKMLCIFRFSKEKAKSNLLTNYHNTFFYNYTARSSLITTVSSIYSKINKFNYSHSVCTELICKLNFSSLNIFLPIFCFTNLTPNLSNASSNAK